MRIDPNIRTPEAADAARPAKSNTRAANQTAGGEGLDKAQLSLDQAHLQALEAKVNGLPEVRGEKVEALRQVIREGNYEVTPEQTAEAMFAELLARSPGLR
ncbi:MAG: flagellar biosynthesis anti-sigma factor FlgM [Acidobacteriia bacterium]|nr:flagellar biosynthesis anti-sigma factor FlgM [Terriglobia bacterium]